MSKRLDDGWFEETHRAHRRDLERWLRRQVQDPNEIEELVQEAFAELFERRHELRCPDRPLRWLKGVVKHLTERRGRAESNRRAREHGHSVPEAWSPPPMSEPGILRAVLRLEPIYRDVIWLRYFERLTLRQIADVCGATPKTVSKRLHRAHRLLESPLRAYAGTES